MRKREGGARRLLRDPTVWIALASVIVYTWITVAGDRSSAFIIIACHLAADQAGNVEYEVIESLGG